METAASLCVRQRFFLIYAVIGITQALNGVFALSGVGRFFQKLLSERDDAFRFLFGTRINGVPVDGEHQPLDDAAVAGKFRIRRLPDCEIFLVVAVLLTYFALSLILGDGFLYFHPVNAKQFIDCDVEIKRDFRQQGDVREPLTRFPYLKILVMYECLRLLAQALISVNLLNFAD